MKTRPLASTLLAAAALTWAGSAIHAKAPAPAPEVNASASPADKPADKPPVLTKAQIADFEAHIRPILAANCYQCHSIETGKAKGGLTLDTREGLLKGGEHGPAIEPWDADASKLITAIGYHDPDLQMPPKGEKLSDADIATLKKWVDDGAPDPRTSGPSAGKLTGLNDKARAHWAYQQVKEPAIPSVKNSDWVKTPVDAFVLAKLEANDMHPSPTAPREVLIRRASYDLIGLPPTPEEVQAFVNDTSANAFEKVVERLLASPHYGERWGRFWLDSARYSDTTGNENAAKKGEPYRLPHAWTYRDYVINAFNTDKPYDQFLKEQIAADQLPEAKADPTTLAALGFLTLGKRFPNPNDTIDERIDTLGKATMGLTVACARCHDHKFDPIPTADYYSLHGVFVSTVEPEERPIIGGVADTAEYSDFKKKLDAMEQKDRDTYFEMVASKGSEFRNKAEGYLLVAMAQRKSDAASQIARNKMIVQYGLSREIYQYIRIGPKEVSVLAPLFRFNELEADEFAEQAKPILDEIATGKLVVNPFYAGGKKKVKPTESLKASKNLNGGRLARTLNPIVVEAFKHVDPGSIKSLKDVAAVYQKIFKEIDGRAKEFVEANRHATSANSVTGFEPSFIELAQIPAPVQPGYNLDTEHLKDAVSLLPQQNGRAFRDFLFFQINELEMTHPGAPAVAMVVNDAPNVRDSYVFIRGEALNRGPVVPRRFLEVLTGPNRQNFKIGSGRLELANAIASKNNPLTARVMMNRVWLHHFGEGFVRTPDDLGVQSEPPSHPELLDYLSNKFVAGGWSVKQMHRMIMLSNTYQQSSDNVPEYSVRDGENRLLWRANLRRLDFEAIRDTMLQMTGKLDPTIGGKPMNLTDEPYSNRRSVYGYIDRGNVPELMQQFDFSDPDMANSRRTSTIVPQQALFFMNSPMSVDVARKVTSRPEFKLASNDNDRVRAIYEVVYQRAPRPEEVQFAIDYVATEQKAGLSALPPEMKSTAQPTRMKGEKKFTAGERGAIKNEGTLVERRPLTAWELYAQTLLCTNELAYVN